MLKRGIFVIFLIILSSSVIALTGDFDNNEIVEFSDFVLFAKGFNDYNQDGKYDNKYDLNKDNRITVQDFFIFAENFNVEISGEYDNITHLRFKFEGFKDENVVYLIDSLCGKNDWINNDEVYTCNFENGNELDGIYEVLIDVMGPPLVTDRILKISPTQKQDHDPGAYAGLSIPGKIEIPFSLDNLITFPILTHELAHDFKKPKSMLTAFFEEGQTKAVENIVGMRLGFFQYSSRYEYIETYYVPEFKISLCDLKGSNRGDIYNLYYDLSANLWMKFYFEDKDYFKKIYPLILNKINEDVLIYEERCSWMLSNLREANPDLFDRLFDDSFVLDVENENEANKKIINTIIGAPIPEFVFAFIDDGKFLQNFDFKKMSLNIIELDYQGKILTEYPLDVLSPEGIFVRYLPLRSENTPQRKEIVSVLNYNNRIYTAHQFVISRISKRGIFGFVAPYNSGKMKIKKNDQTILELNVKNGVFVGDSKEVKTIQSLMGKLNIIFEGDGKTLEKTIYKYTPNYLLILSDVPVIDHILKEEYVIGSSPLNIKAKINDNDWEGVSAKLFYKNSEMSEFKSLDMKFLDKRNAEAVIPESDINGNFIEYYILAFDDGISIRYPYEPGIGKIDLKQKSVSPLILKFLNIENHNFPQAGIIFINNNIQLFVDVIKNIGGISFDISEPFYLSFSKDIFPRSNGDLIFIINKDSNEKLKIYYPEIDATQSEVQIYIAADGSTYWKKNDKLGINNPSFNDAVRNGHLTASANQVLETAAKPAALNKPSTLLKGDFDGNGCVDNNDFNFAENEIKNWINEIKTLPAEYEYAIDCSTAGTKKVADSQCGENGAHVYEIGKTREAIIYLPSEREIPRGAENDYIKSLTCLVPRGGISVGLGYSTIREPRFYPGGNQLIPRRISACYEEKKLKFDNIHSIAQSQGDIVYLNSLYLNKFGDKSAEFNDLFIGYNLNSDSTMWDAYDKDEFKKLLGQGCVAPKTAESFASCDNFQDEDDKNKCLIIAASKHSVVNEYCFDDNKNFDESKCTPENIGICDSIKDSINRQNEINLKKICNEKYKLYVEAMRSRLIR